VSIQKAIHTYLTRSKPGKSEIAAGLRCGFLWSVCKKISSGDIVLSPDGRSKYFVGEVQS
jgi:restriction system protein